MDHDYSAFVNNDVVAIVSEGEDDIFDDLDTLLSLAADNAEMDSSTDAELW